jgi:DNA-binding response OmpR family regulator
MSATDEPVVLVVEDEPDVGETYELWLAGDYEVRRAATGTEALEALDEDVDVVLLDRMLPGMSGEEVLSELRDRGHDVQVAMVTAVDPDFDIVEMGFDAYVTKPPTRETLLETITDLLERRERTDRVREYRALLSKRAALEGGKSGTELVESDAYAELEERIAAIEQDLEADEDRLLDDSEFVGALRDFEESDR